MENITGPAPFYSLYSQDVHSCCCSSSHKVKLGDEHGAPPAVAELAGHPVHLDRAYNVPSVVLYRFVLLILQTVKV